MTCLGIIGTAGRREDGVRFAEQPGLWRTMCAVAQIVITLTKPDRLVSGGAAGADHIAVLAYLNGDVPNLTLHLPTEWTGSAYAETGDRWDPGRTSNHYHRLFDEVRGTLPGTGLHEIKEAITKGAEVKTGPGGFKARNTDVARQADCMLAFTFGKGAELKDGGTQDTWGKYLAQRLPTHARPAYHYCLNSKRLYTV